MYVDKETAGIQIYGIQFCFFIRSVCVSAGFFLASFRFTLLFILSNGCSGGELSYSVMMKEAIQMEQFSACSRKFLANPVITDTFRFLSQTGAETSWSGTNLNKKKVK